MASRVVPLCSQDGTGHCYWIIPSKGTVAMNRRKYDPKSRKHVLYIQCKKPQGKKAKSKKS